LPPRPGEVLSLLWSGRKGVIQVKVLSLKISGQIIENSWTYFQTVLDEAILTPGNDASMYNLLL
jgi:hypothetical protein